MNYPPHANQIKEKKDEMRTKILAWLVA